MLKESNLKKLIREPKRIKRDRLLARVYGENVYFTNAHWLIAVPVAQLPIGMRGFIPTADENPGYCWDGGMESRDQNGCDMQAVIPTPAQANAEVTDTRWTVDIDERRNRLDARLLNVGGNPCLVNAEYWAALMAIFPGANLTANPDCTSPIVGRDHDGNLQFIVMPLRVGEHTLEGIKFLTDKAVKA